MRNQHGLIGENEDFTSEENFVEIEHQLDVFISFFKKQWGITKKSIRKKAFKELKESIRAEKEAKKAKKNGEASENDSKEKIDDAQNETEQVKEETKEFSILNFDSAGEEKTNDEQAEEKKEFVENPNENDSERQDEE